MHARDRGAARARRRGRHGHRSGARRPSGLLGDADRAADAGTFARAAARPRRGWRARTRAGRPRHPRRYARTLAARAAQVPRRRPRIRSGGCSTSPRRGCWRTSCGAAAPPPARALRERRRAPSRCSRRRCWAGARGASRCTGRSSSTRSSGTRSPTRCGARAFVACISDFCRAQLMRLVEPEHWEQAARRPLRRGARASTTCPRTAPSRVRAARSWRSAGWTPMKGFARAARGASRSVDERVRLTLVGDGPERARAGGAGRPPGLAERVRFAGALGAPDVTRRAPRRRRLLPAVVRRGRPGRADGGDGRRACRWWPRAIMGIPELVRRRRSGPLVPPGRPEPLRGGAARARRRPRRAARGLRCERAAPRSRPGHVDVRDSARAARRGLFAGRALIPGPEAVGAWRRSATPLVLCALAGRPAAASAAAGTTARATGAVGAPEEGGVLAERRPGPRRDARSAPRAGPTWRRARACRSASGPGRREPADRRAGRRLARRSLGTLAARSQGAGTRRVTVPVASAPARARRLPPGAAPLTVERHAPAPPSPRAREPHARTRTRRAAGASSARVRSGTGRCRTGRRSIRCRQRSSPTSARQVEAGFAANFPPTINTRSYSTPVYTVRAGQRRVPVHLVGAGWSTGRRCAARSPRACRSRRARGPRGAATAHIVVWQPATDTMWELWGADDAGGRWQASGAGGCDGVSRSPGYFTDPSGIQPGATATSLPLAGGLITPRRPRARRDRPRARDGDPEQPRYAVWALPAQRSDGGTREPRSRRARASGSTRARRRRARPAAVHRDARARRPALRDLRPRHVAGVVTLYARGPGGRRRRPVARRRSSPPTPEVLRAFPWDRLQVTQMDLLDLLATSASRADRHLSGFGTSGGVAGGATTCRRLHGNPARALSIQPVPNSAGYGFAPVGVGSSA